MESFFGFEYASILGFAGLTGVAFYIGAYAGLQFGLIRGSSYTYTLLNLAAATFVLMSLAVDFNLSSVLIQVTWITISIVGLTRVAYLNAVTRLNKEEAFLVEKKLPGMTKPKARKFLNSGEWINAAEGTVITLENRPARALYFLSEGEVDVTIGSAQVATSSPGTFIGEMTCFSGSPATATVTVSKSARLFRISTEALNTLCNKDSELQLILENSLGADTRNKLIAANAQLTQTALAQ